MTREQFNEIKERLAKYREVRYLTYENQQAEFLGNVFEKISEYFKAKDDLEKVKALCDIAILYLNSFNIRYKKYKELKKYYFAESVVFKIYSFISETDDLLDDSSNKYLYHLIYILECISFRLNFDFYKCMIETIKEIESRTGYYDNELKKFVNKLCAFNKDEAISNASKDFGLLGNSIICRLTQEDKNFWFINCKEIETNLQIDYKVKKIYKADYEGCKL
ncbi:hypothetical protein CD56_03020 [Campylobacter lari]|uniref:hypothetical protein n=1 Tax=Campylobacter lari TaxID=201 RepID=UPI00064021E5|nr:hypothetical protein [Campylobacter lari]AKJ53355.1 hypothetical protein CD56_03020 [Campylobacter lari]